jgi:adenylyl- and sulfurtransferase ThiI
MNRVILIKYGELSTKKANRNFFIKTLSKNIEDKLKLGKEIYVGSKSNGLGTKIGLITSKECMSICLEEFLRISGKTYDYKQEHSLSVSSEEKAKIK